MNSIKASVLLIVCCLNLIGCSDRKFDEFKLPSGEKLIVLQSTDYEVSCPYFFVIEQPGGVARTDKFILGTAAPEVTPAFRLIAARDSNVVVLVELSSPTIALVLYDTQAKQVWPSSSEAVAKSLKRKANEQLLGGPFELRGDATGKVIQ